ncbi:hypothetical protein [Paludisphaera borealis]|uniref:PEP-CTERM sorting domain-containing protein n=1 Tax=Paludisphaera borealis TaxID=1387353 RepID=A0A1U7CWK3_9BACT|nr:hypothetical protein [Paludisphaera borealis]APW63263.1 hypothetical protein BSF38_04827 [Paludisphaera borealis]
MRVVRVGMAIARRAKIMKRSKLNRPSGLVVVPRVLALSCGVFGVGLSAQADTILLPADLKPGQTFQVAFVTNGTLTAESSDIAVYNNFVTLAAAAAGLDVINGQPVTWTAIISTATVNARDNAPQIAPVYDVDSLLITAVPGGLWNTTSKFLNNPINTTESGNQLLWGYVGTGSNASGVSSPGPTFGSAAPLMAQGDLTSIFPSWLANAYLFPGTTYHLYALSSPITIREPNQNPGGEPGGNPGGNPGGDLGGDPGGNDPGGPRTVPEASSLRLGMLGFLSLLARWAGGRWKPLGGERRP